MAKYKNAEATGIVISHWLSARYALDYLGIFERLNNPNFNVTEFGNIRAEAGRITRDNPTSDTAHEAKTSDDWEMMDMDKVV